MTLDGPIRLPLSEDLEAIARSLPTIPRPYRALRSTLALLPSPLAAVTQASLPVGEVATPQTAAEQMGFEPGVGTLPGAVLMDKTITADKIVAGAITTGHLLVGVGANLVPNPSFEEAGSTVIPPGGDGPDGGEIPGWPTVPLGARFSEPGAGGHSGARALRFAAAGGSQTVVVGERFSVVAGRTYVVKFWVRGAAANAGSARTRLNVRFYSAAGTQLSNTAVLDLSPGTSQTWVQAIGEITADATAIECAVVPYSNSDATAGDISFVDDIECFPMTGTTEILDGAITTDKIAAAAVVAGKIATRAITIGKIAQAQGGNLVTNPGFEFDGNTNPGDPITGWADDGSLTMETTASPVRTGAYSLVLRSSSASIRTALSESFPVDPNGRFLYRVWVRGNVVNAAGTTARIRVQWLDKDENVLATASVSTVIGTSTTWTELSQVRVPKNDNAATVLGRIQLQVDNTGTNGDFVYFDDVEVYRADEDINAAAGDVTITAAGVSILNGKLEVKDSGGTTTITGSIVQTAGIAANAITTAKLAANAVTANEIAANAITTGKIQANAITGAKINANEITVSHLTADSISTSKIQASAVTSGKIEGTINGKKWQGVTGTAGSPAVSFSSDTNTGFYQTTGGEVRMSINGTTRMSNIAGSSVSSWTLHLNPSVDATYDLGNGSTSWNGVYYWALHAQSDAARKTDIAAEPLGLDFLKLLIPRVWRWRDTLDTAAYEAAVAAYDENAHRAELAPLLAELEATDPDSAMVETLRGQIAAINTRWLGPMDRAIASRRAGARLHHGFVAQEVKAALDTHGVSSADAAFWSRDPSGNETLDYTALLAPVVNAIKELDNRLAALGG